jgi:hypothetical protein
MQTPSPNPSQKRGVIIPIFNYGFGEGKSGAASVTSADLVRFRRIRTMSAELHSAHIVS